MKKVFLTVYKLSDDVKDNYLRLIIYQQTTNNMLENLLVTKNISDIVALLYQSKNPFKLGLEIESISTYETLSESDKEYIHKHLNKILLDESLKKLNYCVTGNSLQSIELINDNN